MAFHEPAQIERQHFCPARQTAIPRPIDRGKVYPSKSAFTIYLHGGSTETQLLREKEERAELARAAAEEAKRPWTDPATGLMWTRHDNGDNNDLNWQEAVDYCQNLNDAGHADWRLPAIEELKGIMDRSQSQHVDCCTNQTTKGSHFEVHIKGNIQLSSLVEWSTNTKNERGEIWANFFDYEAGYAYWFRIGFKPGRALCVRAATLSAKPLP